MLWGEGDDRGHDRSVSMGEYGGGIDKERHMSIGADAVTVPDLPLVHRLVLIAQDGMDDFLAGERGQLRKRRGRDVLMLANGERDGDARHPADERSPDPAADQDLVGRDGAPGRFYSAHSAIGNLEPCDLGVAVK